jgi:hypothetical protein
MKAVVPEQKITEQVSEPDTMTFRKTRPMFLKSVLILSSICISVIVSVVEFETVSLLKFCIRSLFLSSELYV